MLCDVLGWASAEAASLLGSSTASINSALQRARETLSRRYPDGRPPEAPRPNAAQEELLRRYLQAWERHDLDGVAEQSRVLRKFEGLTGEQDFAFLRDDVVRRQFASEEGVDLFEGLGRGGRLDVRLVRDRDVLGAFHVSTFGPGGPRPFRP